QSCLNGAAEAYEFASEMDDCENYEANDLPYAVYGVVLGRAKSDIRPLTSEEKESGYFEEVDNFIEQPELVETNGWISVKDKLPEIHEEVLVTNNFIMIAKFNGESWITSGGILGIQPVYDVTHWQPLPEPPREQ
ncbi:DUF551 domain-containing protein, partial [Mannheimia haemolytica]|nr:DUF551 domain-containing protein [Mannheimia haemolytica]MDW1112819.1 DUF551 domain-containing protein [Mannheimia haemolytica]MDW1133236.1 DUF551 domain-containing protein [Mannheimia haemolytica]MDW1156135.1 DUF551 domain-containing protein [Mannheimia haemolytica]